MGLYIHVNFGGSKLNKNLNCDKKKKKHMYMLVTTKSIVWIPSSPTILIIIIMIKTQTNNFVIKNPSNYKKKKNGST